MSGLIGITDVGEKEVKNTPPVISNLRVDGKVGFDSFTIKYTAEDFENDSLKHYISINNEKKEITDIVNKNVINNEFTYTLSGLQQGTNYNIQIEVTDGVNVVNSSINVKTNEIQIYGVRVMENNSNPNSCCTYIEGAVGTQVANSTSLGGWADKFPFNKIRIVGFKNGKVVKAINPNNKTKYVDGSSVPSDVDVMIEIPKVYWKFTNISNGYELRISDKKIEGYDCYAHKVGGVEKDYIYVGAYLGYVEGNKLRSRSGVSPTVSQTIGVFRQQAQANGGGYQQFNWFTLILLQNLYLIAYKNLNSQQALGQGVSSVSAKINTGGTNTKGMIFGSSNGGQQVCFLGVEDFYGNIYQWVDGMKTDSSYNVMVTPDNRTFNDNASGFKNVGKFVNSNNSGNLSKVAHTNEGGYFPKECSGSGTTYYCDNSNIRSDRFAEFGGDWADRLDVGAFYLDIDCSNVYSYSHLGSRLVFLG